MYSPLRLPQWRTRGDPFIYISIFYALHLLIHPLVLDSSGRLAQSSRQHINSNHMTNSNTPRIPDSLDMQRLQAMQLVAKMKESAERHGIGFIGGFIAPNGEKFVMTNMEDEDDINQLMPENLK
jgi:hypothetical protein